jgi:hypothetical protein
MSKHLSILACLLLALPSLSAAQAGEAKPKDQPAPEMKATPPEGPAGAGPTSPAQPPANPATVLAEIVGTVKKVDRGAQRLDVESAGQTLAVTLDRNTMVYTPRGLGTVVDLEPGAQVRVGRNAKFLAYWVQVRPAGQTDAPVSTPAQGSSPTTGAGPPAEGGTPAAPTGTAPGGGSTTAPGAAGTVP